MWFDPGLTGFFITSTLLHLGEDINLLVVSLDNAKIKSWKDLVEAFPKQYKFNLEIAPDWTSLMSLEKRSQESIRVYAQRWRDETTHAQPSPIDKEMMMLFAITF